MAIKRLAAPNYVKKPIKTDLFNFVTLRPPQLIQETNKNLGFVFNNQKAKSLLLKSVTPTTPIQRSRIIVRKNTGLLKKIYKTYLEVKKVNPTLYNFSSWLMDKNSFNEAKANSRSSKLKPLSPTALNLLWDNLYYQVLTRKSSYVRQACIQMIIANNYISKYKAIATGVVNPGNAFERLANAKVVIDKAFSAESTQPQKVSNPPVRGKVLFENNVKSYFLNQSIQEFNTTIQELEALIKTNDNAYQVAYDKALLAHKKKTETLITPAIKALQKKQQAIEDAAAIKENRPRIQIPYSVDIPEFNFVYTNPKVTNKTLSKFSNNIVTDLSLNVTDNANIKSSIGVIEQNINQLTNELMLLTETVSTTVISNGVVIPPLQIPLKKYCFQISVFSKAVPPGGILIPTSRVVMQINLGSNVIINSESHTIFYARNSSFTSKNSQDISLPSNNYHLLNLFPVQTLPLLSGRSFQISGQFVLSNGDTIDYTATVTAKGYVSGCATVAGTPPPANPVKVELFGVSKIGIADFRKVEQEVCCYVPGQVSHIENVLAREYKERSTRSLLSSENTTEQTSEKEVENLTDTTTTDRNEMQSEVSSVLTEDQSSAYGASAGVNVKFNNKTTFNANGYADFANSNSSTISNSNAESYAKEITERTLERIVKKVSKKQTSRILKEFEENNKHGFDNRKGTEHVSGVYRWIDIIYKNQLINYGKRLMYEFMIPEPAKFYHEIMSNSANNPTDICNFNIVKKPKHPSNLGYFSINNSSELNLYNYQKIASVYGIEIEAPPTFNKTTGVSFTKSQAGGDGDNFTNKADKKEVDVPEGYISDSAQVKINCIRGGSAEVSVSVGNKMSFTQLADKTYYFPSIGNHTENVPVTVYFNKIWVGVVNVNINFKRTPELFQQWQNQAYTAIIEAYEAQLSTYNNYLQEKCTQEKIDQESSNGQLRFNPLFNRVIEKRELKRLGIEMLTKPFNNPMGKNNYTSDQNSNCDMSIINQNAEFENHAAHVKFFEQAFDWEIMGYLFYPYYWADKCNWKELFTKADASDPIFQAFLQSGMARAVIPVRPGFEDAVLYYMETGDIWNGGDIVLDQEDDLYISIADEMAVIEETPVGEPWETRVPTSLTMIQKDTVGLEETGLPCCNFVMPSGQNPIIQKVGVELGVVDSTSSIGSGTSNKIQFSFFNNTGAAFTTIGEMDLNQGFPWTVSCMGQSFTIQRDAKWFSANRVGLVFKKLAEQLSFINGLEVSQDIDQYGNSSGLKFIVDTTIITTFTFNKSKFANSDIDTLTLIIGQDSVKIVKPTSYLERVADKNGVFFANTDLNTNIPISRFRL